MKLIGIALIILLGLMVYSMAWVAGKCNREEERRDERKSMGVDREM